MLALLHQSSLAAAGHLQEVFQSPQGPGSMAGEDGWGRGSPVSPPEAESPALQGAGEQPGSPQDGAISTNLGMKEMQENKLIKLYIPENHL